jgi:hypothetical protein
VLFRSAAVDPPRHSGTLHLRRTAIEVRRPERVGGQEVRLEAHGAAHRAPVVAFEGHGHDSAFRSGSSQVDPLRGDENVLTMEVVHGSRLSSSSTKLRSSYRETLSA